MFYKGNYFIFDSVPCMCCAIFNDLRILALVYASMRMWYNDDSIQQLFFNWQCTYGTKLPTSHKLFFNNLFFFVYKRIEL